MDELNTAPSPESAEGKDTTKKKEKLSPKEFLYESFEELCYVVVLVILLFMFVGRMATVVGSSMSDTLQNGDRIIMTNLFYTPERYDVVVVAKETGYYKDDLIIKRIIAMEGETVRLDFENWQVIINETLVLNEPYIKRELGEMDREDMISDTFVVPEGCYFVMGDNRNGSTDSRSNLVGYVKESEILGHAVFRLYPFDQMKIIK